MEKDAIHFDDFYRIIHGDVPLVFYIELVIRALFVYVLLIVGMRLTGKRISSQLSLSELAAISTLAAATGLVILAPDRGLLPPIIVILVVFLLKYFTHKMTSKSSKFERIAEGHLSILVVDGVIQNKEMKQTRISKEQLFAHLRDSAVTHLGMVSRFYLEANGTFSLIRNDKPVPGLPTLPEWDTDFINEQEDGGRDACGYCGSLKEGTEKNCRVCSHDDWKASIIGDGS